MDEFIILLVIAFVVLGGLFVFGGPIAEMMGESAPGQGNTLAEFSLGRVGFSENDVYRTIAFGSFGLGQTQEDTLRSLKKVGISKSYFGEDSKTYEIQAGQEVLNGLKNVRIKFGVDESNLLGNLKVRWNDVVLLDKVANLASYNLKVDPNYVATSNILHITAGDPGLYFWASSTYLLNDLEVVAEYGPEKFYAFEIFPNELEAWNLGVLSFYTTSGNNGELSIKLNGIEIYRETNPEHLTEIELKFSDIANKMRLGENVLSLKSDKPFYIDNLKFDISLSTSSVVMERDFVVGDIKLPQKGYVMYYVDDIFKPGVLKIKINNYELNVQNVRSGENVVEFPTEYLVEGKNIISFSGTGSWDISTVRIVV